MCERVPGDLELGLQTVVSCHVGAGIPDSLEEHPGLLTTMPPLQCEKKVLMKHCPSLSHDSDKHQDPKQYEERTT